MESFDNNWSGCDSEILSLPNLSPSTISSDPALRRWQWFVQSTKVNEYIPLDSANVDLSNNSQKSSEFGGDGLWGEKASFVAKSHDHNLGKRNRSHLRTAVKELANQRIEKRRLQNRVAQRNFRQRQGNERKMLEEKLRVAEHQCNMLNKTCSELNSVVIEMKEKLEHLEAENIVLRTGIILRLGEMARHEVT